MGDADVKRYQTDPLNIDQLTPTDSYSCPHCGRPNLCRVHKWASLRWLNGYRLGVTRVIPSGGWRP